jgi:hypothetical protein
MLDPVAAAEVFKSFSKGVGSMFNVIGEVAGDAIGGLFSGLLGSGGFVTSVLLLGGGVYLFTRGKKDGTAHQTRQLPNSNPNIVEA